MRLSPFWTTLGIKSFRTIRGLKKGIEYFFLSILYPALRFVGRIFLKIIILPLYKLFLLARLRIQRMALPVSGFLFFLLTNKYLFHIAVVSAATAAIFVNIQNRQALAQDMGQRSMLYQIMTSGESEIIQEDLVAQDAKPSEKRLAGTIEAIPHIDFDYENSSETLDGQSLSSSMPGTVVLRPTGPEQSASAPRPARTGVETYVVKAGDTLGSIARDNAVDVGTILWANNLSERQYIRPGDTLRILPVSGVAITIRKGDTLAAIADRYNGTVDEIIKINQLNSEIVPVGKELIIPGGEPPVVVQNRTIAVARNSGRLQENGVAAQRQEAPSASPVSKPGDATESPNKPKTKLLWPTSGHVITQYYGWRHTGLDLDGDYTSPLYAAEDGVVDIAGWNSGGYGLMVLIAHSNGMKTRYGHASKLFVKTGDQVKRGQVIAMMGSTGRSTGSHLHFEVYVNGKRVNPLVYIR